MSSCPPQTIALDALSSPRDTTGASLSGDHGHPGEGALVLHIALQGCLKAGPIQYGLTADTGGHIRYLLELVEALARRPEIGQQIIVTRAFDAPHLGEEYALAEEAMGDKVTLWRCRGRSDEYLPKESLWAEIPALADSLLERLAAQGLQPDLVHAHYADAGVLALKLKSALGVPFVFTPHSLGASKALNPSLSSETRKILRRRIRYEELALRGAAKVITSSEHEAESQCGLYRHHDLCKTLVNPPGCTLSLFRKPAPDALYQEVDAELSRFLRRPDRPCLLALARPVEKKNLYALVRAYGESAELREQCNLVIYAGASRHLDSGEPEACHVWQQLLEMIDHYDLYGDVAYPKQHDFEHVPAIYQWAARRQGVFVNPALNEPFGLTLLEAAAVGLPVVATQEGGPVDIVRRCQHGRLIRPTNYHGLAQACHAVVTDAGDWQRYSQQGRRNVGFYTWNRHAAQYVRELELGDARSPSGVAQRPVSCMLATDMDGTLLGDASGLRQLANWLDHHPQWLFVVATGRRLDDTLAQLTTWRAPLPDYIVTDVGSNIYRLDSSGQPRLCLEWHQQLGADWRRRTCRQVLSHEPLLSPQAERTQSPYKLSYVAIPEPGIALRDLRNRIECRLVEAGLSARVVMSHGALVDVLPPGGGKAAAVEFIRQQVGVDFDHVVTAGDSGNDIDLLAGFSRAIAVANHTQELQPLRDLPSVYWAQLPHAGGILEGLQFWHRSEYDQPIPPLALEPGWSGATPIAPIQPGHTASHHDMEAGA